MKYLLLFLLFLALGWHWRSRRAGQMRQRSRESGPQAITMVPCAHCATHLPQHEAVAGAHGFYCSAEHRAAREP